MAPFMHKKQPPKQWAQDIVADFAKYFVANNG